LVPDEVVNEMMRVRLAAPDCEGFVLDGYPRTLEQAEELQKMLADLQRPLNVAIELAVPDDVIVERAVGRLLCPSCGAIYHLTSKPPRLMGVCDIDRGVLQVRDDDKPSTVRHRLAVYHRLTAPVLEFYRATGLLRTVNGVQDREQIADELQNVIASC